jgi:predicted nuclease of predicted toxin-antitoxin system
VRLLIDMNLTPEWVEFFASHSVQATHWSSVGPGNARDREIMSFALGNGFVVFTHDLDFGSILAATNARGPSVIQVRTQDPVPFVVGNAVIGAITDLAPQFERGALVTVEMHKSRSRVLPLFR